MKVKRFRCNLCGKTVYDSCNCVIIEDGKVLFNRFFFRYFWRKKKYYHSDCAEKIKRK